MEVVNFSNTVENKNGFLKESFLAFIAFFDWLTPQKIILFLIFLQPFLESARDPILDIARHLIQRFVALLLIMVFIWQYFSAKTNSIPQRFGIEVPLAFYVLSAFTSVGFAMINAEIDYSKVGIAFFTLPLLISTAYLFPVFLTKKETDFKVFKSIVFSFFVVIGFGVFQLIFNLMTKSFGYRLSSIFYDPNIFSRFILIGLFFIIAHLVYAKKYIIKKNILISLVCFGLICLVFTFSRSGYATFLLGLIVLTIFSKNRKIKVGVVLSAIVIGILSFSFLNIQRNFSEMGSLIEPSSFNRLQLLFAGVDIIMDNWLLGIGYTNFPSFYVKNYVEGLFNMTLFNYEMLGYAISIHNWFVEVWAEQGIIGLISFVTIFVLLLKKIKKLIELTSSDTHKSLLIGSYLMICLFLFHGLFYHTFISQFYFWVMLGVVFVFISAAQLENKLNLSIE